jgi:membrane protein implicated in regulation of membrane protease activity
VQGLQQGYRILTKTPGAQGCLGTDGVYSLVRIPGQDHTVAVLGSTTVLTNQSIVLRGNAALALGLFGSTTHLVWYRPSLADAPVVLADGSIPTPPWVQLAIALAFLVLLATIIWRARRLGPIVVEKLPVTVRSSETLEGRARLYQRASARGHALDALRIGSIARLATLCGLPALATLDEVVGAVAALTSRDANLLRALLVDDIPTTDRQLVHLSDELSRLEDDVARAVVPA